MSSQSKLLVKSVVGLILMCFSVMGGLNVQAEIEEIVVTAQKREKLLSKVPVSVQALSGEALVEMGIADVKELFKIAPSVTTLGGSSSAASGLKIRGIGNPGFGEGIEPSVGVSIDGVSTGPGGSVMSTLFDIDRIEVLRGPQGTLFGKNSTAGVVSIITKGPTDEFEVSGRIKYLTEFEDTTVDLAISGPVSDSLKLRASGFLKKRQHGETSTPVNGEREGEMDRVGLRLTADYESGSYNSRSSITYVEQEDKCCARVMVGLNEDPATYGFFLRTFLLPEMVNYGVVPGPENQESLNDGISIEEIDTVHLVHDMSYELNSGQVLRSITGYRNYDSYAFNDTDMTPFDIIDASVDRETTVVSQEFQFLSQDNVEVGGWEYLVGVYLNSTEFVRDIVYSGGTDFPSVGNGTFGSTIVDAKHTVDNYAVFGNARYQISEDLAVFGGVRLLKENSDIKSLRTGDFFIFRGDFGPEKSGSSSDTDWTGRVGLEYQLSDQAMLFTSLARGYKGEAINFSVSGPIYTGDPNDAWVDPETIVSFEVGIKTHLFDGNTSLNATVFFERVDDYQADSVNPTTVVRTLRNAGELESNGVEVEFVSRLWEGFELAGNLAYTKAKFKDFDTGPCTVNQNLAGPGCVQDLAGKPLNGVPEFAYYLSARQDFTVGKGMLGYVRAEYSWRDDVTYGLDLDPYTTQESYGLANFRVGLELNDKVELIGFVENAFDELYSYSIADYTLMSGSYAGYVGYGRTYGVELRASF